MSLVKVVLQDMRQALEFVMSMFVKVLRSTTQILEHLMSRFTAVLQSMPSPLEIGACIAVVDVIEGNNYFQMALAVTSLFLAVCDWHVPRVIAYHNFICRFLSAICLQIAQRNLHIKLWYAMTRGTCQSHTARNRLVTARAI